MLQIGIIGDSSPSIDGRRLAFEVGEKIAEAGCIMVCGGLGGVMEEACRGAKSAGGITVGILPGVDRGYANPYVDIVIATGLGEARNVLVVKSCLSVIAIEGGYGTLSEIAFALRAGVRVVGLNTWEMNIAASTKYVDEIIRVSNAREAVDEALLGMVSRS
ncbi:MAG: TIGR00725 family protein [Candidatus Desantisbacteria bacterium]